MSQLNHFVKQFPRLYRSLVITALLANGIFQFVAPVLAEGTTAGQSISNTATATYEDPNNPGTTINTTSNTVTVTVAEVAGITVTASGITDNTSGTPVVVGDILYYNYTITNVGNDPTKFRVPNLARVTGPATAGNLEYSTDGGTTWTPISGSEYVTDSIPVDGSILVRVPVTVQPGAQTNDVITVTLGDAPGDGQNQLRDPNGGDVYTVDNADGSVTGEVAGTPVNGVREASATQKATVNSSLKNYALATILKTRSNHDNANTPVITDDTLSYGLSLRVELNDPTGNNITPVPLVGTTINGLTGPRILISDAIPNGTELAAVPTPPPGWQVVYTTDPISINANDATWQSLTSATNLSTVTRVGFVNDPAVITSIAPGQTVSGFSIKVKVKSTATSPLTVNNIAQLFGQTSGGTTLVYDESGDQSPSNYDGQTIPPGSTDTNNDGVPDTNPAVTDGYINDTTDLGNTGTDSGNNNSGSGPGGEANTFTVQTPLASDVLNGPERTPDAIGPTSNNDDFTNKSSFVPPNQAPGSTLDPSGVAFTNTVQNSGTDPNNISLVPTEPTNPADLPVGTLVTITYGAESKSYVWDGDEFLYDADRNPNTTNDQSPIDATSEYITIPNVAPGTNVNYGVEVNLPANTPLSTDIDKGFPVPITAFVDDGTPGLGSEPQNTTIDRVYTGFLKLVKESRILPGTGPAVQGNDGTFSSDPKKPAPGNIIEYRITYKNISEAQAGTGNILLRADKVVITEDGTTGGNNWALDNDSDGKIDTSNIVGSAKDSGAATINFYNGNPATNSSIDQTGTTVNTDVTKYVDTVTGNVAPGESRTFTFQRKVN
ncbi:hypothetical protein CEN45_12550 [Fischerella thermalis CCMEE 5198]|uniref:DUF7925 domain-containing protein n=1 Tax=Fischerella thermalis TaxID=372787 RepID=UPI000C7F8D19|nr:hypothetical protein [Fischerella thermalis]PLZ84390.1 hypothetical protein CI594_24020 [Fischerella thermalis CCMEE 5196]PMB22401.1 hypothetical protein CEN45_12550 [Fischerella thermalis CCMEE 5198]